MRVCVFVACVLRKPHDAKDVNCSRVAEETGHVESPEKRQEEPAFKISWWWRDLCQLSAPMLFLSSLLNISTDACSDPQTLLSCFWVLHITSSQHTYSHKALGKQKSVYDVFNRSRIIKTSCVDKKKKRGRFRNRPNKVIAVIRRFRLFVSILLKYNIIKSCDLIWCELDTQTHTRRKELTSASESRDRLTPRSFYLGTHRSIGRWSISDNRWLSGSAGGS